MVLPEGVEDTSARRQTHGEVAEDVDVETVLAGGETLDLREGGRGGEEGREEGGEEGGEG